MTEVRSLFRPTPRTVKRRPSQHSFTSTGLLDTEEAAPLTGRELTLTNGGTVPTRSDDPLGLSE